MFGKKNGKKRRPKMVGKAAPIKGARTLNLGQDVVRKSVSAGVAPVMGLIIELILILDKVRRLDYENTKTRVKYPAMLQVITGCIGDGGKVQEMIRQLPRQDLAVLLDVLNGCLDSKYVCGPMPAGILQTLAREAAPVMGVWNRPFVEAVARVVRRRIEMLVEKGEEKPKDKPKQDRPHASFRHGKVVGWRSGAIWSDDCALAISIDDHESPEAAKAECMLLHADGLGGHGKEFPVHTWTEPIWEGESQ